MEFSVIGITDAPRPCFTPDVVGIIRGAKLFSGGRRHHQIVAPLLPPDAVWTDITVPLDDVFRRYASLCSAFGVGHIVVFASGDPLFFGFANTIRKKMPEAAVRLFPAFNSLQMLAHRMVLPYHDMKTVSLTGRPWKEFDRALIEREAKIGVLTDHEHTPAAIAARMMEYGYTDYRMTVGECLGHPSGERVRSMAPDEAAATTFGHPNCLILVASRALPPRPYGIPDHAFSLLDGRERMITKMPVRLLSLQAMELYRRAVLWDIGFCTGSISVEARLQFPHLDITAFEVRPEGMQLMRDNSRKFGAPGISVSIGDFLYTDISGLSRPDAVFIGGHGGRLEAVMEKVLTVLQPGGCLVMNSVTPQSRQLFGDACSRLGLRQQPSLHISINDYNPIDILKATR
jgi:precorrin-6Y C5,15-methyltransferase (decarboxylating)